MRIESSRGMSSAMFDELAARPAADLGGGLGGGGAFLPRSPLIAFRPMASMEGSRLSFASQMPCSNLRGDG